MKKVLSVLTVLVVVSMLFSCADGSGSGSDNAPVKVSLNVATPHEDISKVAAVNSPATTFTYWYAAIPQWTGYDFTAIQGATGGTDAEPTYVQITDYAANKDIGLFAQGSWKFYAQVKANGEVVYESAADPAITYINASNRSVTLNVTRSAGNGTATVSIDIEVPDTSASSTLTVAYSGQANGSVTLAKNDPAATKGANWSRFTGTASDLASGQYLFTLTTTDGTNNVGGAVLAFDILPGVNRSITGTVENGVWQTTLITINVPTFNMSISAANGATSVAKNTALVYTCTATATNITGNIEYQWYVNNTAVTSNGTGSPYSFSFSQANPGNYYVTCKAYVDGQVAASQTLPVTVTN